jgi:two-component system response regulator VicR
MKKIMIVDDEPDLVFSIKYGLEDFSEEYKVIGAKSGRECFVLLKNGQMPDLILLDVMMPEMNGWDVFTKLKEKPEWREIPVVFLTAKTDPYSKGFGKMAATEYIAKPCDIKNLEKRIDKILKKQ